MDTNKILTTDILDIVFEGKNKEYGAYDLRKTYNKRLRTALLGTVAACLFITLASFVANKIKRKSAAPGTIEITLEKLNTEEKKIEPPKPIIPPKTETPQVEISKVTPPKIVADDQVKPEDVMKDVDELEYTKISNFNRNGDKDDGITAPPVELKGTGKFESPKQDMDYDGIFTIVQIQAQFPGGKDGWQKYLERNLNRDLPVENGAPAGKYTVVVTFIVDKTGAISDVAAENDPGYGTKDEAIRVVKKGPSWLPAEQNGRKVIYRHRQSITFVVSENE
jgi:protein TonB